MEAIYGDGERVFVRGLIVETDEDADDVRYVVDSSIAHFRVSQKDDIIKRNPDSYVIDVANAAMINGMESYYKMIKQMMAMSRNDYQICFGEDYTSMNSVLESTMTPKEIYQKYAKWANVTSQNPQLYELVQYNGENCAILGLATDSESGNAIISIYQPSTRSVIKITNITQLTLTGQVLNSVSDLLDDIDTVVTSGSDIDREAGTGLALATDEEIRQLINMLADQLDQTLLGLYGLQALGIERI